jgi:hypothetical protein
MCTTGTTSSSVSLGDGVKGVLRKSKDTDCGLTWQQRGWTIDVDLEDSGTTVKQSVPDVGQIVQAMATAHLPAAQGLVAIANAGDGEHTMIYWTQGHALYWVGDYHSATGAIALLSSVESMLSAG